MQVQLLLFSATFNDIVKRFAMQIAPSANHVFVAKEELSLDVIAQYNVRCVHTSGKCHCTVQRQVCVIAQYNVRCVHTRTNVHDRVSRWQLGAARS